MLSVLECQFFNAFSSLPFTRFYHNRVSNSSDIEGILKPIRCDSTMVSSAEGPSVQ
jgi:hypothetical protein